MTDTVRAWLAASPTTATPVDHKELRRDPVLALLAAKRQLEEPFARKSTLNLALERSSIDTPRGMIGLSSDEPLIVVDRYPGASGA